MKTQLILASLLLSACASQPNPVETRRQYWEQTISAQIPIGTSRARVMAWMDSRHLSFVETPGSDSLISGLEYIPVNSFVCNGFGLSMRLVFNADRNIAQESVNSAGNCI